MSSSRNDSPTTPPISSGSRDAMSSLVSTAAAVTPPTWMPVPATSSRSVPTSRSVSADCGLVVGTTVIIAASPPGAACGGVTAATPGVPATRSRTCASAAPSSSETSSSGPFAPGPKPSASMSYACRVVVPARSLPASGKP